MGIFGIGTLAVAGNRSPSRWGDAGSLRYEPTSIHHAGRRGITSIISAPGVVAPFLGPWDALATLDPFAWLPFSGERVVLRPHNRDAGAHHMRNIFTTTEGAQYPNGQMEISASRGPETDKDSREADDRTQLL